VTGGVDGEDNLLSSAEFYSVDEERWQSMASLKHGRTEHGEEFSAVFPA